MENHSYGEVVGSASSRYVDTLARECGLATNYAAVSHPSLPNYIAATSGRTWGITNDDPPSSHRLAVMNIFRQAPTAGSFEESMPSDCVRSDSGPYVVKHDPETYYVDVGSACRTQDVPLGTTTRGALVHALETETLPAFSFVTPNLCSDTHNCSVQTGDSWLARWVSTITMSPTYRAGRTVLFITWDENDGALGNHVAAIVVSPYTMPRTRSALPFSHYSLLRTTEELLGIRRHLGDAAGAQSMSHVFGL
jgi:phosphatidylinositol-3-phosphatase